jgi:hypothetical protein
MPGCIPATWASAFLLGFDVDGVLVGAGFLRHLPCRRGRVVGGVLPTFLDAILEAIGGRRGS